MKKILLLIVGLFAVSLVFTSCLNDDDTTTTYSSDAAITAFSISNIETEFTTRTYDDSDDSTYTVTLTGSDYTFVIDQANNLIYNPDSLTYGTNVSKVVTSVTNGGYSLTYKKNDADTIYTSTDSIDFTSPAVFKSWAQNGTSRQYTVKINVHQCNPDSLIWNPLASNFKGDVILGKQKAVLLKDKIFIYGENANQVMVTSSSISDGTNWTPPAKITGLSEMADYSSAIVFNNNVYILCGSTLYKSDNGTTFSATPNNNVKFKQLLAINGKYLNGLDGDNKVVFSSDGTSWNTDNKSFTNLPDFCTSYVNYNQLSNPSLCKSILMGTYANKTDSIASVWEVENGTEWSKYDITESFDCPNLVNLSMIRYNGKLYAFGGHSLNKITEIESFKAFYNSIDEGISWRKTKENMIFPTSWLGNNNDFSFLVDSNNYIWIIFSKSGPLGYCVWRGQLHRLAADWLYK